MGHVHVSHPTGRLEVVPICSRQIGRQLKLLRPLRHALPNNKLGHSLMRVDCGLVTVPANNPGLNQRTGEL